MEIQVEIVHAKSGKSLCWIYDLLPSATIAEIKQQYKKCSISRQSFRLDPRGKALKDGDSLEGLGVENNGKLYFKDLGPQIGWGTVFIAEYAGPLLIYLMFYQRPAIVYGVDAIREPRAQVVEMACACWVGHYAKRLLETMFVHRFSHGTMPVSNLFKNCSYYWGFAAFVAYFVNHPLYTPPMYGNIQMYIGLTGFILNELGNLSIHLALRNLRPAGSTERKIPYPTWNPFTVLFKFVSCPNYTYEVGAWLSFSILTQCLPAALFMAAGGYQMLMWALGKHRNYRKEFKGYPRSRRSMIPFIM